MSEIATVNELMVPVSDIAEDPMFKEMTRKAFLPRIELFSMSKKMVKSGKFPGNHWGMIPSKDKLIDLGASVLIMPLEYRYLAIDFTDLKKIVSSFDPNSSEFKRMQNEANRKDRKKDELSPCAYGFQFLIIIKDAGFATYFASSASSKAMAPSFTSLRQKYAVLSSYFKEQGPYAWQCPEISLSNSVFDLPPVSEINEEIEKFKTFRDAKVETEPDQDGDVKVETVPDTGRPR